MQRITDQKSTLVLSGTGKTGRRVVERLEARGRPVRVGSRFADRPFDWEEPSTWRRALENVGAVYVSYHPDIAVPGAVTAIRSFVDLAVASGVERLVLLSGRGEEEAQRAEEVVQRAGVEWTVVRCAWFAQNFSESFLRDPILDGELALPAGDVREPFVDADDIADVAAAALTDDGHAGQVYELTGPRLLTFAEAVGEIASATGREIAFVPVSLEDYVSALLRHDVPVELVDLVAYLFAEVLDGRNAHLADGVQRALGRQPRDFADYARAAAATGVWSTGQGGRTDARAA